VVAEEDVVVVEAVAAMMAAVAAVVAADEVNPLNTLAGYVVPSMGTNASITCQTVRTSRITKP
jgi:hypothetical protein